MSQTDSQGNHDLISQTNLTTDEVNRIIQRIVAARVHAERAEAWAEREKRRSKQRENWLLLRFGVQLQRWTIERIGVSGKRRSIDLPAGRIGFRQTPPKLVIEDESLALLWAKASCPEAVERIERLKLQPLHAHIRATGELPDGAQMTEETDRFFVR